MIKLPAPIRRIPSIAFAFAALLSLLILGACHLTTSPQTEETFTFPTLKEKIAGADHVTITLKDTTGKLVDVLFDGPVDSATSFQNLSARNYKGGKVVIDIEAKAGDVTVYRVERGYDAAKGGNLNPIITISPDMGVKIQWSVPRVQAGQTLPLPGVQVLPVGLRDPSLTWVSRHPSLLEVTGANLKGIAPGAATLVVWLKADTTRRDSVTVQVVDKDTPVRTVESLTLDPDSLVLALRGPVGRLRARLLPVGAPEGVTWSVLGMAVSVDTQGNVQALTEGSAHVVAVSKADPAAADTAKVHVLPARKVDSVRFAKASLDLIAGGAAETVIATVFPALANPAVELSVADKNVAKVEGQLVFGLKEGETNLIARSVEDPSQSASLPLVVFPAENVDSVRLQADSVVLYVGGEGQGLTASIHPATLQPRFLWKSADPKVVEVDPQGKLTPKGPGKAYVSVTARADARRSDSALVIVRKDTPRLHAGGDTVVSAGSTVTHRLTVAQDYGTVVQFKADLDGDGTFEDSSATVPATKSYPYTAVKEYLVKFYVRDSEGNDTVVTRKVSAVTGRVVQITSPKDGSFTNQTPIPVKWLVDGVEQTNSQPLDPGENTVVRTATDPAGKVFSHSIKVHLDLTAPNRPTVKGSLPPVSTLTPTWTWVSGGGGGNGTFRYRLDNPDLAAGVATTDTFHTAATNLTEGAHTLYVQERDEAGNWSPSGSAQIRIDTTAPAAPAVTVTPSGVTNNRRPAWNWTGGAGDASRYYRFKFGNDDFRSGARDTVGTGFRPSVDLAEGVHTLFVQVRDSAGNWSNSESVSIRVDITRPQAPIFESGSLPALDHRPTWKWKSSGGDGVGLFRFRLNDSNLISSQESPRTSFVPDAPLPTGHHTLYLQERDSAGNWSASTSRKINVRQVGYVRRTTALGGNSDILRTIDGGEAWDVAQPAGVTSVGAFHFLNAAVGFAAAAGGFYMTKDSGETWSKVSVGSIGEFHFLAFADPNNVVGLAPDDGCMKSSDGGATWLPIRFGTSLRINGAHFPSDKVGFVVGDSGLIFKTTDGGGNWRRQESKTIRSLLAVHFSSKDSGYAVGDGVILKTINGGQAWYSMSVDSSRTFTSVQFLDGNYGMAAGWGALNQTNDGGWSWINYNEAAWHWWTPASLQSIYVADSETAYASGRTGFGSSMQGLIIKSSDGGQSWTEIPGIGGTYRYDSIQFP